MGKQPYRVLQVVAVMDRGGTETMLMNHYRALDKTKVQFDFLVHYPKRGAYENEIEAMGGLIFRAPAIRPWSYPTYFKWLSTFFKNHASDYIAVHAHIQENSGFALYYAKKHGIIHRLMTSHTAPKSIDYKILFRRFANIYSKKNVTDRLACGIAAGKYLYGKKDFKIVRNAINTEAFAFNEGIRNRKRKELGIADNEILIGHVGRFDTPKNQTYIVRIIENYIKNNNTDIKAALVGTGTLQPQIKQQALDLGISDNILFLGSRSDVNELLQAFDIFLMPSIYEGLPVSVIEAQTAGLPCILSDTIDKDCDITGNVSFLSLNQPLDDWCDAINKAAAITRADTTDIIAQAGYDVHNNLNVLLPLYGITK